ncbi:methylisocitrate lyase [Paenibacillus xylaniclasticus]|uniref:methylisocitrate lyase n=1 Tax=Paenibacillus xylaniclasticus TaxID=588083 RepID=UPI00157F9D42|nr:MULTISPECIES: methylisocitrate lyase [Paenibacillus]GFN31676.1 2-methylisocitrate lyase [Paenibacillus curdlanolyticus]
MSLSPGQKLRDAVKAEQPLQLPGVIHAYAALLAESVGFRALYISGAGIANASFGLPDLGITTMNDCVEEVRRITHVTKLPVLVDADTGFGSAFAIARTIKQLTRAGAAGVHIEDQVSAKRCGHRPNKAIVSAAEMIDRIKSAVDAREDPSFVIMARTDAIAVEGLAAAIERACAFVEAGADMIFPEAVTRLEDYRAFADAVKVPVLANMTEFGRTPLFTVEQLCEAGVGLVLYPLSAFRAMSAAALNVYRTIREHGTQQSILNTMQTRDELYHHLNYWNYEQQLDRLFGQERGEK